MSASTLWIAIAGGAGAFLGAAVGQLIQWLRDRWQAKLQDRRRAEDAAADAFRALRDGRRADLVSLLTFLADLRGRALYIRSLAMQSSKSGHEARTAVERAIVEHTKTQDWLDAELPGVQAIVWIVNFRLIEEGFERFRDFTSAISRPFSLYDYPEVVQLSDLPQKIVDAIDALLEELVRFRDIIHNSLYPVPADSERIGPTRSG